MQKILHRTVMVVLGVVLVTALVMGCSLANNDTGTIKLSLTDAPIADAKSVEGVFITISSIQYNLNDAWIEDSGFEGPQKFNLLELTGGTVAPLSNTLISAGEVTQIRFMLDAQEQGATQEDNPKNYIVFDRSGVANGIIDENDDIYELFVPSGSQTGYKAVGTFTVPSNGVVEITADFDVRKSVVKKGVKDEYLLKPTIRLIVNNQAGTIDGTFIVSGVTYDAYTIFVYADGTYTDTEAHDESDDETFVAFENAISSAAVDTDLGTYILPFLAAGTYDLVIVGVDGEGLYTVIDSTTYSGIVVEAELTTSQNVNVNLIE